MSWAAVARKDFRDAARSRALLVVVGLYVLVSGAVVYLSADVIASGAGPDLAFTLQGPTRILVPLTAAVVGYKAVVGELDRGTIKLLLKQPHSRADVVLGKAFGRSAVVAAALVAGLLAAALVAAAVAPSALADGAADVAALGALALALALVYVSVTVGISAATRSTNLAVAGAVGSFLLFEFLWTAVAVLVRWVANGFSPPDPAQTMPEWATFLLQLNPSNAYQQLSRRLLYDGTFGPPSPADPAFYEEPWFAAVVLGIWIVFPTLLGYLRFRSFDL